MDFAKNRKKFYRAVEGWDVCGVVRPGYHYDFRAFPHSWEVGGIEYRVEDFGEKDDCFLGRLRRVFGVIKS